VIQMHEGGLLMQKELADRVREVADLGAQLAAQKARYDDLFEENDKLRLGMREILESIRDQDGTRDVLVTSPVLEMVVTALDARHLYGEYKPAMALKAQMERLEGVNAQLREQLRRSRLDDDKAVSQLSRLRAKHQAMEAELAALKQGGGGASHQALAGIMLMPAVQPMVSVSTAAVTSGGDGNSQVATAATGSPFSPSATESLAQLNNQLIHVMDELEAKQLAAKELEKEVERYSREYSKMKHQMGLLYEEHFQASIAWKEEKEGLEAKINQLKEAKEANLAKILEYEQLWDTWTSAAAGNDVDSEQSLVRAKLADTARKIGLLKSNEALLTRKYTALEAKERLLREENLQLRTDMVQLENHTLKAIGAFQRSQDAAAFKTESLLKTLEESVPAAAMDQANRQYNELTAKYRDLLQQQAAQSTQTRTLQELELQAAAFKQQKEALAKELTMTKEKVVSMEALINAVGLRRGSGGGRGADSDAGSQLEIERLAKQVGF